MSTSMIMVSIGNKEYSYQVCLKQCHRSIIIIHIIIDKYIDINNGITLSSSTGPYSIDIK